MLVLTRKADQKIQIGEDVCITIVRVKGNAVRIGIEAPRSMRVVRDELDRHPESETAVGPAEVDSPVSFEEASEDSVRSLKSYLLSARIPARMLPSRQVAAQAKLAGLPASRIASQSVAAQ